MCKTFNKLPNDPLVRALKPVQIEWINWHLQRESEAMNGKKRGGGFRLESASDVPSQLFGERAEGRQSSPDYLGKG